MHVGVDRGTVSNPQSFLASVHCPHSFGFIVRQSEVDWLNFHRPSFHLLVGPDLHRRRLLADEISKYLPGCHGLGHHVVGLNSLLWFHVESDS